MTNLTNIITQHISLELSGCDVMPVIEAAILDAIRQTDGEHRQFLSAAIGCDRVTVAPDGMEVF